MNYYNEWDPRAAAWLRELIKQGLIPPGHVDTRSITDVSPADLAGYAQCHFFAGIGGWPLALQLAGWRADDPCGTASCPCQPFSSAGEGKGQKDERHLWPIFNKLRSECRALGQPWTDAIFGEQVAAAIGFGWLDGISADLEAEGYAVGAAVLGAHSVRAPHIRQRLYWVANAASERGAQHVGEPRECVRGPQSAEDASECGGIAGGVDDSQCVGRGEDGDDDGEHERFEPGTAGNAGGLAYHGGDGRQQGAEVSRGWESELARSGEAGAWSDFELVPCADGKARRIESGTFPLAHGVPGRVGLLRGYGNAIVPQVAAEFIKAFIEATNPT
jgi:DNA (cytosine-5)-methyltransferase 1